MNSLCNCTVVNSLCKCTVPIIVDTNHSLSSRFTSHHLCIPHSLTVHVDFSDKSACWTSIECFAGEALYPVHGAGFCPVGFCPDTITDYFQEIHVIYTASQQ